MKRATAFFLNLIVIALVAVAVGGYFFSSLIDAKISFTFNTDIANLILTDKQESEMTEEEITARDLILELAKEEVSVTFPFKLETTQLIKCATSSYVETQNFLFKTVDEIADGFDEKKMEEVENSIMRASLKTAIRQELKQIAENTGEAVDEIMKNLNVDEDYIANNTETILNSVKSGDATVDSVSLCVLGVIEDVYGKIENSEYSAEVAPLTPSDKAEIKKNIEEVLSHIAEEDGSINAENFASSFITDLISSLTEKDSAKAGIPSYSFSPQFAITAFNDETPEEEKTLSQTLKETFREAITPDFAMTVKNIMVGGLGTIAVSCAAWLWLVLKIILKMLLRNPLIKLKMPLIFGWTPCIPLFILPKLVIWLLTSPPAFIQNLLGADLLSTLSAIFGSGITFAYSSSAIFAGVATVVLFVYGIFYSIMRKIYR